MKQTPSQRKIAPHKRNSVHRMGEDVEANCMRQALIITLVLKGSNSYDSRLRLGWGYGLGLRFRVRIGFAC